MRNIIVAILFILMIGVSINREPVIDTIDSIAGATNTTYGPSIDSVASASNEDGEDEHEDDEDEDEWDD